MRSGTFFWGGVLVLLGFVLLLDNLGLFGNLNVWSLLGPGLLILLGIWVLWGNLFRKTPTMEHASLPLQGAARARLRVQHGAGRLNISAGASSEDLLEGDFGGGLDKRVSKNGDTLDARLSVPPQFFPFFWTSGYTLDWRLNLNRNVPLTLDFETGAGESVIDLTDLRVAEVSLKSGASATEINLPSQAGSTRVRVSAGAASVKIRIPQGVAAHIRSRGGLSSTNVDTSRFPKMGDVFQSSDYDQAANKVDMDIEMGVGSVEIL